VAGAMTGLIDLEALFAKAMADVESAGGA